VQHAHGWIWLGGPTRIGKTRALARALVIHLWRGGKPWHSFLWLRAATWCEDIWARDATSQKRTRRQLDRARDVDILIFDDFGQEAWNERIRAKVFDMLDYRHMKRRRTWFTSNANREDLLDSVGNRWEPMRARILERGWIHVWDRERKTWNTQSTMAPEGETYWYDEL
jgi:DNA replication protein DnaC